MAWLIGATCYLRPWMYPLQPGSLLLTYWRPTLCPGYGRALRRKALCVDLVTGRVPAGGDGGLLSVIQLG